jgi:uncharacterized protein
MMGSTARLLSTLAARAAARPRLVLAIAAVVGLACAGLALRLHPTAAASTFVSSSSSQYRATQTYYHAFGEEPVAVLVEGNLAQIVETGDLDRLLGLEECLAGRLPAVELQSAGGAHGPCAQLDRLATVKVVLGPATFLDAAATQINETLSTESAQAQAQASESRRTIERSARGRGYTHAQATELGKQAERVVIGRFEESVVKLALQYGITSRPSIADPNFVSSVVFDPSKGAGTPKQRFAYLFPSSRSALISVRMRAGLSEGARNRTIALIRSAVALPGFALQHGTYAITGVPVIVADLTSAITHSIELLMAAVVLVMAAALGLLFTGRPRLLPLALAILATAITFGALSLAGASLTVATVAVLPVLVGLAVDYSIQFQSRARETGSVVTAAALGGPTIVCAAAASAAGILALLLSPVPMVRGFAVLLVGGVAIALLCALIVGSAALSLGGAPRLGLAARSARPARSPLLARASAPMVAAVDTIRSAWNGARELLHENALTRLVMRTALGVSVRHPARALCVGLALAALGWGLDTQTRVETDITKLVPQSLSSLRSLDELERTTGVAGEIDLMVSGPALTSPAAVEWMSSYESRILARYGYSASRGCGRASICPAFSLPDLLSSPAGGNGARHVPATALTALLAAIPPYLSQDVITPDHRTATLAFGIRQMSLRDEQNLVEAMSRLLHPPHGVSASLVGLPVLAARSGTQVADPWRRVETLVVGLAAVALVLLIAFRGDRRRTIAPLIPVVLATGWSALILYAVRVPLNPMSVTLGVLVIAISTEFSVLLSERHRQERADGHDTLEALRRTYRRTGAAIAASGATATAGFGVLALSDIRMLRDFGLVTLIDLSVSLVGVLVSLPAVVVIADGEAPVRGGALPRRRRNLRLPALAWGQGLRRLVARARRDRRPRPSEPAGQSHAGR